ncbi:MAG: tetratricopeptide repeat protein [Sphingobium sp.]
MRLVRWSVAGLLALLGPVSAWAGEEPLYQPAPAWVTEARLPDVGKTGGAPAMLIFDHQQRIEDGQLWAYVDSATRAASTEMLGQLATLTLPWLPDKGDLIVHELKILRDDQTIDLLASGKTFTVLRREEGLEQRQMTGILTATMAIEGLRVGDILRLKYSATVRDAALGGRVQSQAPLIAAPIRMGFGRLRLLWDKDSGTAWKMLADGDVPAPIRKGGQMELVVPLPLAKQPDMPGDAPGRFLHPPLLELSTFSGWADVSRVMAPLYDTKGLIPEGSPLATELAAMKTAGASQLDRAQRALRLVQDEIRYLALGMNGGNYVPQKPEQTWASRYGDCKAKTLLLLALLHGMDIEAEPVLAHSKLGDLASRRLPSAAAFDHVLVHAVIEGEDLWLDGTGSGSRIEDIHDTPPFHNVLPLRIAGAELMPVAMHPNARPTVDLLLDMDESASVDVPSVFDATAVLRGPIASMFGLAMEQLDKQQRSKLVGQFFARFTGEAQFSDVSIEPDAASGTTAVKAHGVAGTSWQRRDKTMKRQVSRALGDIDFAPDRSKPAWADIPVATPDPVAVRYRMRIRLPDGGRGYTIEGTQNVDEKLGGFELNRTMGMSGGVVTIDERVDSTGDEIAVTQIPAERDRIAVAGSRAPTIVAPANAVWRWQLAGRDPKGATQITAAEKIYAKAIAENPDEIAGLLSRASLRKGIGNRKGALADLDKAIEMAPDADLYLQRSDVRFDLGDITAALSDAEAARQLDPASVKAVSSVAELRAEQGDLAGAVALLDERIALGGETRDSYRETKASLMGTYGDPEKGLELINALIGEKPGSPSLLNSRCWIKGTRNLLLDTALKDCTSAIELSSSPYQALDSRALVWLRLGRYDNALRDLNAALDTAPSLGPSRFLRGIVLGHLNQAAEGAADLAAARQIAPRVDSYYSRFGIKP